jgi:PDZ domain-containing protein
VGVVLREKFTFPVTVKISVGDVGGPSAGLMFSLGIYDKLTPQELTGGRFIAGTGTITPEGQVGPIGGIQQKMVAARAAGATVFLTPTQNCGDAVASDPKGLRLVRVDTMHSALQALSALRTGQGSIPACAAK